jgi:2-hydroxy-6-oxonona-2,4-dienedioate hydrolase
LEASLRVLSVIRNSQLLVFNRCGHWAQIEHADVFNALVSAFINGTGSAEKPVKTAMGG